MKTPKNTEKMQSVVVNFSIVRIRRDVMTILTHHAASRQAAMAPYGKMLLARERDEPWPSAPA